MDASYTHTRSSGTALEASKVTRSKVLSFCSAASTLTWKSELGAYANEANEYSSLFFDYLTGFYKETEHTDAFYWVLYEVNSTEVNLKYSFIRLHSDLCTVTKYINSGLMRTWRVRTETIVLDYPVPEPEQDWVPKQEIFEGWTVNIQVDGLCPSLRSQGHKFS